MNHSASASNEYTIAPWDLENVSAETTSPLDEFRSPSFLPSSPSSATDLSLSSPHSDTLSSLVDQISPLFVETAGRQYKLTEIQISNLRMLHEVSLLLNFLCLNLLWYFFLLGCKLCWRRALYRRWVCTPHDASPPIWIREPDDSSTVYSWQEDWRRHASSSCPGFGDPARYKIWVDERAVCMYLLLCEFYIFNPPHRQTSGSFHNSSSTTTHVLLSNQCIWMYRYFFIYL